MHVCGHWPGSGSPGVSRAKVSSPTHSTLAVSPTSLLCTGAGEGFYPDWLTDESEYPKNRKKERDHQGGVLDVKGETSSTIMHKTDLPAYLTQDRIVTFLAKGQ